jgi:RND superfamily putative drug exporter
MLPGLARWCYRRRWTVLISWIVLLVGLQVLAGTVGGDLIKTFSLPGSESQAGRDIFSEHFEQTGDNGSLVFKVKGDGTVQSPETQKEVLAVVAKLKAAAGDNIFADQVLTPWDGAQGQRLVSPTNPKIAAVEIPFKMQSNDVPIDLASKMRGIVEDANTDNLQLELGGYMFVDQTQPASEFIGILAAIIILLIAFGSLLAMGLPIVTALFGIGCGIACVTLLARFLDVPSFAPQVTLMIGIGVGIDYALFISTRYREALHEGCDPEAAVVHSIDTSGRAVLFAGGTVVISLLGLVVIGVSFIRAMAFGAALAVIFVMLAAVTLLPGILGFVGRNIDKFSLPGAKKRQARDVETTYWARWSRSLQKHPWPYALLGLVILVGLTIPALNLRLGIADSGNDPTKMTTRRAYDLQSEGFGPGSNGPLFVISKVNSGGDGAAMEKLAAAIAKTEGVANVSPVQTSPDGQAVAIIVQPTGSPQDESTTALVHRLRDDVVPGNTEGSTLDVKVASQTAAGVDLADTLGKRLPYMFLTILAFSFILLLLVFRSILVPLKAVIMNLLSIGAAYGVIVWIFQEGNFGSAIGIGKEGPIEAWVPMMLFAIVFGLSMDYEVFLLSRIKEEYDQTHDNATAVSHGLAKTARLITAAAAIMICVFGSFVLSDLRVLKLVGFGLAFAVFIDATVVRLILVPATMELLGDRNWWFPKWLEWLPRVNVEGQPIEPQPEQPQPVPVGD